MNSPMFGFILTMWVAKRYTEAKVQSYVPKFITQPECDLILATPQMTDEELAAKAAIV